MWVDGLKKDIGGLRMNITLLEKRIIEAEALAPILKVFITELGLEKVRDLVTDINRKTSQQYGPDLGKLSGSTTLADLADEIIKWSAGDALEVKIIEQTENKFYFNVTRCRFAEAYDKLGVRDMGTALSCCRDFGFIEGFNPKIKLDRTRTIMEGALVCDFRYNLKE